MGYSEAKLQVARSLRAGDRQGKSSAMQREQTRNKLALVAALAPPSARASAKDAIRCRPRALLASTWYRPHLEPTAPTPYQLPANEFASNRESPVIALMSTNSKSLACSVWICEIVLPLHCESGSPCTYMSEPMSATYSP